MRGKENNNKQKSGFGYSGYILSGVACLLLMLAILWGSLSGAGKSELSELTDKLEEEKSVLRQTMQLHDRFDNLQQLDEKYNLLLTSSAPQHELDSLNYWISKAESEFKTAIESAKKGSEKYKAWDNVAMLDSITASFGLVLSNRRLSSAIRSSTTDNSFKAGNKEKQILQYENDIQKKDERISELESQMKLKQTNASGATRKNSVIEEENESLKKELNAEEIRTTNLVDIVKTLRQENEKIVTQLNLAKRSSNYDQANLKMLKSKNISLEQETADLNAELNFARIDCNLARADVKKIISNSRQRKELLSDALQSLESLSQSENTAVKQKAKDKMNLLNQIASTVRD